MTKPPKKPADADEKQFEKVVQHFLNTPPKPHKEKGGEVRHSKKQRTSKK